MRSENGDSFGEGGKVMAVSMVVAFLGGDEVLGSEGGRGMAWGSIVRGEILLGMVEFGFEAVGVGVAQIWWTCMALLLSAAAVRLRSVLQQVHEWRCGWQGNGAFMGVLFGVIVEGGSR